MNRTMLSALKFALLLGMSSMLLSGCATYQGGNHDQDDQRDRPGNGKERYDDDWGEEYEWYHSEDWDLRH